MTTKIDRTIAAVILMSFLVLGCSMHQKPVQQHSTGQAPAVAKTMDNVYWWRCNFQIVWPDDAGIKWEVDLLLAHAVVAPVLSYHIDDIEYWRFHRRAARDSSGHQFSFLFYSTPETASLVMAEIAESKLLSRIHEANLIRGVIIDDPAQPLLQKIEDTSDPQWSPELQRNWPAFIMGASSLWLGLIDERMPFSPGDDTDINLLLEEYRDVNDRITETWRTEGQHALLHHLNAIFGYEPLHIRKFLTF